MRLIAARGGVTLPTLYHYFGDKRHLYIEACLSTFGTRAEEGFERYAHEAAPLQVKLPAFFVGLARELLRNDNFFKLMHRELIDQNRDGIRELAERCWKPSFDALCDDVRPLLREGADPIATVLAAFALMFGLVEFRRTAPFLHSALANHYAPNPLTLLVLQTVFPGHHWILPPESSQ